MLPRSGFSPWSLGRFDLWHRLDPQLDPSVDMDLWLLVVLYIDFFINFLLSVTCFVGIEELNLSIVRLCAPLAESLPLLFIRDFSSNSEFVLNLALLLYLHSAD